MDHHTNSSGGFAPRPFSYHHQRQMNRRPKAEPIAPSNVSVFPVMQNKIVTSFPTFNPGHQILNVPFKDLLEGRIPPELMHQKSSPTTAASKPPSIIPEKAPLPKIEEVPQPDGKPFSDGWTNAIFAHVECESGANLHNEDSSALRKEPFSVPKASDSAQSRLTNTTPVAPRKSCEHCEVEHESELKTRNKLDKTMDQSKTQARFDGYLDIKGVSTAPPDAFETEVQEVNNKFTSRLSDYVELRRKMLQARLKVSTRSIDEWHEKTKSALAEHVEMVRNNQARMIEKRRDEFKAMQN